MKPVSLLPKIVLIRRAAFSTALLATLAIAATASAQVRLDTYRYLLRGVHPASYAQQRYLLNRLLLTEVRAAERQDRQARLDVWEERRLIKQLNGYRNAVHGLSAGNATTQRNLTTFWMLLAIYGGQESINERMMEVVELIPHESFEPTSLVFKLVLPDGTLAEPSLALQECDSLSTRGFERAWRDVAADVRDGREVDVDDYIHFRESVDMYRRQALVAIELSRYGSARLMANRYLQALGVLVEAVQRPEQREQIRDYLRNGGYAFRGGDVMELFQHMLSHRVLPVRGSTAQLTVASVARPLAAAIDDEIARRFARIDAINGRPTSAPLPGDYAMAATSESLR